MFRQIFRSLAATGRRNQNPNSINPFPLSLRHYSTPPKPTPLPPKKAHETPSPTPPKPTKPHIETPPPPPPPPPTPPKSEPTFDFTKLIDELEKNPTIRMFGIYLVLSGVSTAAWVGSLTVKKYLLGEVKESKRDLITKVDKKMDAQNEKIENFGNDLQGMKKIIEVVEESKKEMKETKNEVKKMGTDVGEVLRLLEILLSKQKSGDEGRDEDDGKKKG